MIITSSNFREIYMGQISPKVLYRSNHPISNGKQVSDIILAANYAKINTIINLSDDIQSIRSKIIFCPWYKNIHDNNNVIALNINMQFDIMEPKFKEKIKNGIIFMTEHNPSYLIHCEAGIDRTGFLSIILESFMGATFDEIVKDYMSSFVDNNEYSADDYKNGSRFMQNMFSKIKGGLLNPNEDLQYLSRKYLAEDIGLDNNQLDILTNKLRG
jgi:protein tyrosine/serine phosphatase